MVDLDRIILTLMDMPLTDEQINILTAPALPDVVKRNQHQTGRKDYVEPFVYRRVLDRAFRKRWSWIIIKEEVRPDLGYAYVHGRLFLPGIGVKDGIGIAKIDTRDSSKKDNASVIPIAGTLAFKKACESAGLMPNIHEGPEWDLAVISGEFASGEPEAPKHNPQLAPPQPAPAAGEAQGVDAGDQAQGTNRTAKHFTQEQIERMTDLKTAYEIADNNQLKPFLEKWSGGQITRVGQLTSDNIDAFINWVENHPEEFDDL